MGKMNLGGALQFAGHFAEGFMRGKEAIRQRERDEDRYQREKRRDEEEIKKLQEERAMREELKALQNVSDKPVQAYIVQNPNGQMVYTDENMAKAHAANDNTAQVVPAFVVAGQTFSDKHEAQQAAERMSTPASLLAREASIYKKYGRNDMAAGAYALYQKELETNRQAVQAAYLEKQQAGDVEGAVELYTKNILNGATAQVERGPDGSIIIMRTRAGQPVGQPQVFRNDEDFWNRTSEVLAKTPATLFEAVKFDKQFKLQERGLKVQEGQLANDTLRTGAQVHHLNAQTADIPAAAADRRTNAQAGLTSAGAAATSAGAAVTNANTNRAQLTQPKISAVPDAKGGLNFVTTPQTVDQSGNWQLGKPQVAPAAGLKYPQGYVADQRNAMPGLGGLAAPQVDPAAVEGVLQRMSEEAARREALRRQQGVGRREVTGTVQ